MLVDTHCHIHEAEYPLDPAETLQRAHEAGVSDLIVVGTSLASSAQAVHFATNHERVYASIGVHPHDSKDGYDIFSYDPADFVAVGEIGLDYFYTHSSRSQQLAALTAQLTFAHTHQKPVIFHVREAFDDFWPVFDSFQGLRGVVHSFTDSMTNLEKALERGLYIGVNGISTFTKDSTQQEMFGQIPLDRLLVETDARFLTPAPLRGTINEPAFVRHIAEYHASRRGVEYNEFARQTSHNARELFAFLPR